ncbi:iron complex outermembrane receptor protein [Catalinimonas alkaloidigena]|uniref:TonB-dependent receptor n=1 Tax=Catalinimonas alkaloidigena TaxID=1075417 RepID=UPI002405BFF3|nr:TonB-dependent receptor [Catalinimonas alkaloidigena]MDF9800840.1 iron complex outermembrane receptor protein [Catalinimonas alkaloidigena]
MFKFFLVMLLSGIVVVASGQAVRIEGVVLDEQERPVEDAALRLSPGNKITTSNARGEFSFSGVSKMRYTLSVSHLGYTSQRIDVEAGSLNAPVFIHLSTSSRQLDEVVVEDDPFKRLKKEESLNIALVNDAFIRKNLGGSLMQSMERLPGINIIGIGSGQSKPLIRGLGFNRVVVVDKGVKHEGQQWGADHGLEIDQFAVHQAEVIKGAASFVYGSDAIGGAIDIKPEPVPPSQSLGGTVDVVGKSNNALFGTSINLYGRNDAWFFDTRMTYQDYGDYRVPTERVYVYDFAVDLHENQLRNSAGQETNLHLNTGFVRDSLRSIFYISHIHSKSGFFANAHGLEPRQVDTELHDKSGRDILYPWQQVNHLKLINKSTFHLNGHLLETELGYQHNFRQEFNQYVNHGYMPPTYPEETNIPQDLEREFDKQVYTANLRDYLWIGKHSLTMGLNAEHQDNTIGGWGFLVPAFRQTTLGAFVYDKYQWKENLLFHAALRYDFGHISMFHYQDWFTSDAEINGETVSLNVVRANDLTREFNSVVWSAGMNYNQDKFDLKANLGKSFRMPIAKELGANGVNYHYFSYERGNTDLDPERSYQADLGLSWTDQDWSVSLTPFFNYFSNYIYLNPTAEYDYLYGAGNQVFEYTQSRVVRYGGEIQLTGNLTKSLRFEFLGEYLYALQMSGDKRGYTLPFSPPPSALFNLSWSPQLNGTVQNPFFSVDYRLTSRQDNIVPPEKKTPGFQLLNVQAGAEVYLNTTPVTINLQVQNLLNTSYMNHTSFYRLIGLPEAGRNIILSLKIPFTIKHK